jgi:hypothetical protein
MNEQENKEQPTNGTVEDRKKDFSLITAAFRTPKGGITERLVCQDLFQGTFTDDKSKKLNHLCCAAMCCGNLMRAENMEKAELPFDLELIRGIYAVNASFDGAQQVPLSNMRGSPVLLIIPWAFSENRENFEKLIKPWSMGIEPHYYTGNHWGGKTKMMVKITHEKWGMATMCGYVLGYAEVGSEKETLEKLLKAFPDCPGCGRNLRYHNDFDMETVTVPDTDTDMDLIYGASKSLTLASARQLRARFYAWAVPILEDAKMQMASFISPQTYEDVAKLLSAGQGGESLGDSGKTDRLQD